MQQMPHIHIRLLYYAALPPWVQPKICCYRRQNRPTYPPAHASYELCLYADKQNRLGGLA